MSEICGRCEYFDRHFGDCHNPNSPRFQTYAGSQACAAFYPDTTATQPPETLKTGDGHE